MRCLIALAVGTVVALAIAPARAAEPEPPVGTPPADPPPADPPPIEPLPLDTPTVGPASDDNAVTIYTNSDLLDQMQLVDLNIWLSPETVVPPGYVPEGDISYLRPLIQEIDLTVLGAGKSLRLSLGKLQRFVQKRLAEGMSLDRIGSDLIDRFRDQAFAPADVALAAATASKRSGPTVDVGGYLVTEFEIHEEDDGTWMPLLEVNQTRLYFLAQINPGAAYNRVSGLLEFNPVPEEVIHQVESATVSLDGVEVDLVRPDETGAMAHEEGTIPFERLYIAIEDLADTGLNLHVGQFRVPFGIWSDYTSHRNFSSTKNNTLVNGFALKKIELGLQLGQAFDSGFSWDLALTHGRLGRTSELERANSDRRFDLVGRVSYAQPTYTLGASFYLAETAADRIAVGVDWLVPLGAKALLSGEVVYQRNAHLEDLYPLGVDRAVVGESFSGYVQFDVELATDLRLYGLYEAWRLSVDGEAASDELPGGVAFKVFNGIRYNINNALRWTIFEYGHMFHDGYNHGHNHASTQLELTF